MRYGLSLLVALTWALWFGGLMTLFLTVTHLFAVNRPNAIVAAPEMFATFERYQLVLAAAAILMSAIWRLSQPQAALTFLFCLFALASVGVVVQTSAISPKMQRLHELGQSSGPEFRKLHGASMIVYTSQTAVLFLAVFPLLAALAGRATTPAADDTPPPLP